MSHEPKECRVRFLYVTAPDAEFAKKIARDLLDKRLTACVNVLPGMTSLYRWQGAIETANECVMLVKTTDDRVAEAREMIAAAHPYQVPCVIEFAPIGGDAAYLNWIVSETRS